MKNIRFAALFAALSIALSQAGGPARGVDYPEKDHLPVDYADMPSDGFDSGALFAAARAVADLSDSGALDMDTPDTRARVEELYGELLRAYDEIETGYNLASIRYDADLTDSEAADRLLELGEAYDRATDLCFTTLALLSGSPYADILWRDMGREAADGLGWYEPMTEEETELYRLEEELCQAYERAMAREFTVSWAGREWTADDLYYDETLTEEEYDRLTTQLEKKENKAVGPIFLELVRTRTELARLYGYDSYAEYAHEALYGRDYSARDVGALCSRVRESLVPLYREMWDLAGEDIGALDYLPPVDGESILDAVEPYMSQIDPELGETFRFMREHHLYDIEASEVKNNTGYTVSLPAYGSAFIFDSPYGTYQDYSTLIHEFGHFNETFHAVGSGLWSDFNIDVGEIHSQGLEVLFTRYADDLFGEDGRGFAWSTLLNMVESVLDGCMYNEFQAAVYEEPDMTLEEVNDLFGEIARAYGFPVEEGEPAYFWVEVPHNFRYPMYYVSYATSALSALDLWSMALEDRDGAVETYLDLAALGMTLPYREAVETVGLRDIFSSGTVKDLARTVRRELERAYGVERPDDDAAALRLPKMALISVGVGAGLVILALAIRKERRGSFSSGIEEEPALSRKGTRGEDPWD